MDPIQVDMSQPVPLHVVIDGELIPISRETLLAEARRHLRLLVVAEIQVGNSTLPLTQADINRFESNVIRLDNGCYAWGGSQSKAKFNVQGRRLSVNRVAYQIAHGDLKPDHVVRSSCGTARCINPIHLGQHLPLPKVEIPPNLDVADLVVGERTRTVREKDVARFWSKVSKQSASGCWLWQGKRLPKGYGQFSLEGAYVGAHRISYLLEVGPLDPEMEIDHYECNNPPCVNPSHLRQVTPEANGARIRRRSLNPREDSPINMGGSFL